MEKSNSFKRVLAGTLALLTVASSVPAEAGSVIGDFFSTAIVADAANKTVIPDAIAITNVAVNGTAGIAKVTVNGTTKDATIEVTTPDANTPNVMTFKITCEGAFTGAVGKVYATVDKYTVIDDVDDVSATDGQGNTTTTVFNATTSDANTLTVKVNKFTSITANGTTEYEFDGTTKAIKYGKHIADEAALDTDGNNTVEVAYIDADGKYQVLTEDEIKNNQLFDYYFDDADKKTKQTSLDACVTADVKRKDADPNGTVIPHVITLVGKGKFAGLEVDTNLLITPLDITNNVTVTPDAANMINAAGAAFTIPHVTYKGSPAGNSDILDAVTIKDTGKTTLDGKPATYTLTYEGREDTEAGQTGVLTDTNGKISENAADNVNAVNVGLYTATLNFGNNYTGTAKQSFRIMPQPVSNATLIDENTVVKYILDDETDGIAKGKNYDRKPYEPVAIKDKDNNPYGVTLVTYKAELNANGTVKRDETTHIAVPSTTVATDTSAVGTYVTVVTPSGNYKKVDAEKDKPAAIEWTIGKYNIATDSDHRITVAGEAIVDPSTGKAVASLTVRDKAEVDNAAQAGVRLVEGTEYTVKYSKSNLAKDSADWKTTVPDDVTPTTGLYVLITGTGNYEGVRDTVHLDVVTGKYDAATATLTTKTSTNEEQVKYQYGDSVGATVTTAPGSLTQEVRYVPVTIDAMGAPTAVRAITDHDCTAYFTTDDGKLVLGTTDGTTISALTDAQINALFKASLEAKDLNADETTGHGYIAVVFVNRKSSGADTTFVAACENYKPLFESKAAISKGFTVSRREITDSSKFEIEYVNPLLPYIGRPYTTTELEGNIKSIKVDGVELKKEEGTLFADFVVQSTKTGDAATKDFTDVDNYTMKLDFGANDEVFAAGDNFKGSYTTKADTQKFSIVASQLTAADFTVNGAAILAVYTKDGAERVDGYYYKNDGTESATAGADYTQFTYNPVNPDGWTLAYYKAKQDVDQANTDPRTTPTDGGKIIYDGKEWDARVTPVAVNGNQGEPIHAEYPATDFEVTGDKQTEAGPYEITISGIKNTKGSLTVKWSVDGNSFVGFTATPDKTSFDYNGQGQAPKFTVVKPADEANNKPAVTLTEGKDFAVEYYNGTTQLDGKPVSVGKYTAKIVGIGAYYGAKYPNDGFQFTISPASDLDVTITAKKGADFSYNGEALINRVSDLFDVKVAGKKLEEDADNFIFKIVQDDGKDTDAKNAKNVGKYKISVTVYDDNYQPKTSDQTAFEITPKEITLSNITANVKTAVYGAPVAQINDSITFDYDGVIDADKDKVSVADFRGFVVVSDNYRSGSPAGEYTLVYNGKFVPVSEAAQNYKAKKFTSNEKITIAKRDLADAKPYVSLVVVPSTFTNDDPEYVEKGKELKANQIIYNGKPYEVYIQDNDNGLMTMADLKLTGTPKALHAGSDLEVVATASANGNYTGTATLNLAWAINQCEIGYDVNVSVAKWSSETRWAVEEVKDQSLGEYKYKLVKEYKGATALPETKDKVDGTINVSDKIGSDADALAGKATYFISTNVRFYTVDPNTGAKTYIGDATRFTNDKLADINPTDIIAPDKGPNKGGKFVKATATRSYKAEDGYVINGEYASEAAGDYTVYFYQLDDKGEPIEETKTTGYPTTGGKYRATVEFSKDFKLVNTSPATEDPDFVPQPAKVGYVDFEVKGTSVNSAIYDLNQLKDNADLTDDTYTDNKSTAFSRVYGDAITPEFQIDVYGTNTGTDLVTAKVDVTKMRKFVADDKGAYTINGTKYSLSDAVYDGTAGYYDLEGAVVMNNTDYSCNFTNVTTFPKATINGTSTLVYEVERSTDYTIQFDHENNVFALKNGKAVAGYQVVDDNSGKVMTEGVDYKLKGSNEVYKTGTYTLFVEGIGNYAGTDNADWVVVNGDTSVDAKLLDSNTVSFKDQVEFNFLAEINDPEYVDGAYVIFTYDHYGEKTEVKKMLSKSDMYGKYYRFRLPLTASEMAIPVKAELFLKNSAKAIDTKERSIKDYAETAISKNMDGSNVLKAMLNYGGYTQVALGNNTSVLANESANIKEDVSAIDPKSATPFVRPTAYNGTLTVKTAGIPQSVKVKFTPSVTYKGTTVMTKSKLYVRHYFTVNESMVDEDELAAITVYRPDLDRVDKLVDLEKNSTGYYFDMTPELAYNLDRENKTVKVYNYPGTVTNTESYTSTDGSTVAAGATTYKVGARALEGKNGHNYADYNDYGIDVQKPTRDNLVNIYAIEITNYNVVDYCEAIANNAKQTTANKNMVKALYAYYQAAEAYVAKRS